MTTTQRRRTRPKCPWRSNVPEAQELYNIDRSLVHNSFKDGLFHPLNADALYYISPEEIKNIHDVLVEARRQYGVRWRSQLKETWSFKQLLSVLVRYVSTNRDIRSLKTPNRNPFEAPRVEDQPVQQAPKDDFYERMYERERLHATFFYYVACALGCFSLLLCFLLIFS